MSTEKLPIVAAIPNYNMAKGLKRLLPQILEQNYDHIYVLDDASTDDSEEVAASFGDKVTFIKGAVNKGAGAARNLILPVLKERTLIHFMDADISLVTKDMPDIIRTLGINDTTGFVSGLVIDETGRQSVWNYGPSMSVRSSISAFFINIMWNIEKGRLVRNGSDVSIKLSKGGQTPMLNRSADKSFGHARLAW